MDSICKSAGETFNASIYEAMTAPNDGQNVTTEELSMAPNMTTFGELLYFAFCETWFDAFYVKLTIIFRVYAIFLQGFQYLPSFSVESSKNEFFFVKMCELCLRTHKCENQKPWKNFVKAI